MKKMLKKISILFLIIIGLPLLAGYAWLAHSSSVRMQRLQKCIDREMPAVVAKYQAQGFILGQQGEKDVWLDWLDPEEYSTYPLMKDGKQVEGRYVLFRTDADHETNENGGCGVSESAKRALE